MSVPPTIGAVSRQPQDMRPGNGSGKGGPGSPSGSDQTWRWALAIVAIVVIVLFISSGMFNRSNAKAIGFSAFQQDLAAHQVASANFDNTTGVVTGTLTNGESYTTTGPSPLPDSVFNELKAANVKYTFTTPTSDRAQRDPDLPAAGRPDYRLLHMDESPGSGTDVGDHVDWAVAGQGLHSRATAHDLR